MTSGKGERLRRVRISGGRITCVACGCPAAEVVLLELGRPLCLGCAAEQAGVDIDTVRQVDLLPQIARSKRARTQERPRGESDVPRE